jgi:hypothetical protein
VSVTANNVTGTQVVQVTERPIQDLLVEQNPIFRIGAQRVLGAVVVDTANAQLPVYGSARAIQVTSSDTSVLRIGQTTGLAEPLKSGTTQLTMRVDGITKTAAATVTVMPVGLIQVDSARVERNPGGTFQYTATLFDSLSRRITDRQVTWSSTNSSIVRIDATTGLATAVSVGREGITASVLRVPGFPGSLENTGQFTVFATPVARVEATPNAVSVARGATTAISLIARDASGAQLFNRGITATSDNPAVAIADGSGAIRGIGSGTTTIRFQALDAASQPQGTPAEVTVTVP